MTINEYINGRIYSQTINQTVTLNTGTGELNIGDGTITYLENSDVITSFIKSVVPGGRYPLTAFKKDFSSAKANTGAAAASEGMTLTYRDAITGEEMTTTLHNKVSMFVLQDGIPKPKDLTVVYYWTTLDECDQHVWNNMDDVNIKCPTADSPRQLFIQVDDVQYYDLEQLKWTFSQVNSYSATSGWVSSSTNTSLPDGSIIVDERHKEHWCTNSWSGWLKTTSCNIGCGEEPGTGYIYDTYECALDYVWNGKNYDASDRKKYDSWTENKWGHYYDSYCNGSYYVGYNTDPPEPTLSGETGGCSDTKDTRNYKNHTCASDRCGWYGSCTQCKTPSSHTSACSVCDPLSCTYCHSYHTEYYGCYVEDGEKWDSCYYGSTCEYKDDDGKCVNTCVGEWVTKYKWDSKGCDREVCDSGQNYKDTSGPECGYKTCTHDWCKATFTQTDASCGLLNSCDHYYYYEVWGETGTCPQKATDTSIDRNTPPAETYTGKEWVYSHTQYSSSCDKIKTGTETTDSVPSNPY